MSTSEGAIITKMQTKSIIKKKKLAAIAVIAATADCYCC